MAFPKIDGYVVTEKLGAGSYSTVYKAYTKVGARTVVAIKCVDKSKVKHSGAAIDNLVTEIHLLKSLTHPHIVHMKQFTWDDKNIYIIMEYCCGGDLSRYIRRYGRVPEKQVLYFLQQLASALKFLREKGVVHMDLKPHNLLLHKESDGKYILKVADFGFAAHMDAPLVGVRGSPLYMAPEVLRGEYGPAIDLWSVGVIMYECLFGSAPYSSRTLQELVEKLHSHAPIHIPASPPVSAGCRDLLVSLLQQDPARRISYEQFFAHEYLDLEHMPTKENYEKAVQYMRQAVSQDAAGLLPAALTSYTAALRLLVPACNMEPDSLRRQAFRDKLTRYMERAEQIKQQLRLPQDPPHPPGGAHPPPPAAPPARAAALPPAPSRAPLACCRAQVSATTDELEDITQYLSSVQPPADCKQQDQLPDQDIHEHTEPEERRTPPERGPAPPGGSQPGGARYKLRRLFSRSSPVSFEDRTENGARQRTEDDGCRIT